MSNRIRLGEVMTLPVMVAEDDNGPVTENYDLSSIEITATKIENNYSMLTPRRKLAY